MKTDSRAPKVGLIMGSDSDWKTMRPAADVMDSLGIPYEAKVVSAHRSPDYLFEYAEAAEGKGLSLIIAGAGGAAHLPGMTAAKTIVPVIGVPVVATPLNGVDALFSIMQMPAEVGVATVGIGAEGAARAAEFAASILAVGDPELHARLQSARNLPGDRSLPGAQVAVILGGESDAAVMEHTSEQFRKLDVPFTTHVLDHAAETLPNQVREIEATGAGAFIVGASADFALAHAVARHTLRPVLGVPIVSGPVTRIDEFVQPFLSMSPGLVTFAVGKPGAINTALFAATFLSPPGSAVRSSLWKLKEENVKRVRAKILPPPV